MTLEALLPLYGGYTLARNDGVIFLKGALPGEVVEADLVQKRRDYSVAAVRKVVQPSPDRVTPRCPVFGICGGCHYQYIAYPRQVGIKEEVALECLRRIGRLEVSLDQPLPSEPWHYRRRAQLKVSEDGRIGFYRSQTHEVVEFEECLLLSSEVNIALGRIRSVGLPPGVRELHLQSGDVVIAMVKGEGFDRGEVVERLSSAGLSGVAFEDGTVEGAGEVCLDLNGYHYMVSAGTFFQSNWSLNRRLVSLVTGLIERIAPERIMDLYAGAGNFSIPASPHTGEVTAVEADPSAFRDGEKNLLLNGIENVTFIQRRVEGFRTGRKASLIIVDPPRQGLEKETLRLVMEVRPEWLVYVSCNPSTFARDLGRLGGSYGVESIRLVDMFAQTYHIELLGILRRKAD